MPGSVIKDENDTQKKKTVNIGQTQDASNNIHLFYLYSADIESFQTKQQQQQKTTIIMKKF
jgi:hypothetical protein